VAPGFGHIGKKGMDKLHRKIHAIRRVSQEELTYDNQPVGYKISLDINVGYAISTGIVSSLVTIGSYGGPLSRDQYLSFHQVVQLGDQKVGLEVKKVRQVEALWSNTNAYRQEVGISGLLFGFWQPALKYVSPIIGIDHYSQIFISPLDFQWQF
jgi:hypothetical protein